MATAQTVPQPKLNDLLTQVDEAYGYAQAKSAKLDQAKADQIKATADARAVFDAVLKKYQGQVDAASQEAEQARAALDRLSASLNERLDAVTGRTSDSRVSVR